VTSQNDVVIKCWCTCLYCRRRVREENSEYRSVLDGYKRFDRCVGCAVNSEHFCKGVGSSEVCDLRVLIDDVVNMQGVVEGCR